MPRVAAIRVDTVAAADSVNRGVEEYGLVSTSARKPGGITVRQTFGSTRAGLSLVT